MAQLTKELVLVTIVTKLLQSCHESPGLGFACYSEHDPCLQYFEFIDSERKMKPKELSLMFNSLPTK